ncbi:unnamed protein product [Cyprideis torosa]|uniref:Uncharacterized protein n=1 Tax=Cyprideis torosa TaxID=163714 RepID=A0A7R8ZQ46_9CRUS|nr:unnamed protein product [Cyprideis torosa]CAG0902093.1 unnamed protein product [Cyprideis torosa]
MTNLNRRSTKQRLQSHELARTGEKLFACDNCGTLPTGVISEDTSLQKLTQKARRSEALCLSNLWKIIRTALGSV